MSKVPFTINIDEYICTALEQMRKMNETRDYSGLGAAIERIQNHANAMESALYVYNDLYHSVRRASIHNKYKEDDAAFRKRVYDLMESASNLKGDNWPVPEDE